MAMLTFTLSASLTTWTTQLSTLESRAVEHDRYASELSQQIADPLKHLAARYEEIRKSHAEFAAKLEKERDMSYGDLKKTKGRYDGVCQEVESRRKKIESSFDHGKGKAQNAYQQQIGEMHNVKNTYIISINVTNKQVEKYYYEYVPEVLDGLQNLSETRVAQLNALWSRAVQLENSTLSRSIDHLQHLSSEIPRNDPRLDSMMFARHNAFAWQEPPKMNFEPSPVWLDDSAMATDETAKVFLRNVLAKSKSQLTELKPVVVAKQTEVDNCTRIRQRIREGKDDRDEVELVKAIFYLTDELHQLERKRSTAETEALTIKDAVGDISLGAQNHNFKSQTFKIPTNCDRCGERIWGLSAKGFDCRDCGYTCHSKCEMQVPADCPGEQSKEDRKKLKAERQAASNTAPPHSNGNPPEGVTELPALSRSNTMDTLSSGYAASANRSVSGVSTSKTVTEEPTAKPAPISKPGGTVRKNRIVAPPPTQYVSEMPATNGSAPATTSEPLGPQRGIMLYAYTANGPGELSVDEGDTVILAEPSDGSGWLNVRTTSSETGLVPTTYVELFTSTPTRTVPERPSSSYSSSSYSSSLPSSTNTKKKGPAVAPKRGAKKLRYVEALYEYEARGETEWSMYEGERFVLVNPDGGDGWADVEKGGVVKSVPANYVKEV